MSKLISTVRSRTCVLNFMQCMCTKENTPSESSGTAVTVYLQWRLRRPCLVPCLSRNKILATPLTCITKVTLQLASTIQLDCLQNVKLPRLTLRTHSISVVFQLARTAYEMVYVTYSVCSFPSFATAQKICFVQFLIERR